MYKAIQTENAPKAIGPYSQAVRAGGFLFCSGQIALDPNTGTMVGNNVTEETTRVMQNLKAVLEAAGATFDNVVKTTIYLSDMKDFATVNEVYGEYFSNNKPARATVEVSQLPKGARVEIDAIALLS